MTQKLWKDINGNSAILSKNIPALLDCYDWIREANLKPEEVVFTGLATSLYAWDTTRMLVENLGVSILDSGELRHNFKPVLEKAQTILVISRSGESAEIITLLDNVSADCQLVAITEHPESPLGKAARKVFSFETEECSFANTQSFILSIAYATAVACALKRVSKDELSSALETAAREIDRVLQDSQDDAKRIAEKFQDISSLLIMTRGNLIGLGRQFALDLHEGLCIAAISIEGSLLRHGSIELIRRDDVASVFFAQNDQVGHLSIRAAKEIDNRGGKVGVVTSIKDALKCNEGIAQGYLSEAGLLAEPLIYAVYIELIFYYMLFGHGVETLQPQLVDRITTVE